MLKQTLRYCLPLCLFAVTACATVPTGPSVMVMPAPGKPFDIFTQEDAACRHWAERQLGLSSQDVIDENTTAGAITGTAIGAGVGALLGAASGHAGAGALIGGVGGLLLGATSGANADQAYGLEAQRRYDTAYLQCMYANGNQIPGSRRVLRRYYRTTAAVPPPPLVTSSPYYESVPPPPAGATRQIPPELLENKGGMP